MTTTRHSEDRFVNSLRRTVGLGGAVALIVGILILVWPGRSAAVVAAIFAAYARVIGVTYLLTGAFGRVRSGWARLGMVVLGVLFVIAAVVAFANLRATTTVLALLLGITVGVVWILEAVLRFATLGSTPRPGWSAFSAVISLLAGVLLLVAPLWGAAVLWMVLGVAFVVIGIVQIVRAFRLGR